MDYGEADGSGLGGSVGGGAESVGWGLGTGDGDGGGGGGGTPRRAAMSCWIFVISAGVSHSG